MNDGGGFVLRSRVLGASRRGTFSSSFPASINEDLSAMTPAKIFKKAEDLLLRRHYSDAARLFAKVAELKPNSLKAHFWLGFSYAKQRKFKPAKEQFELAIALHPKAVAPLLALGRLYAESFYFKDAIKCFDKVVELAPRRGDGYMERGAAHLKLGNVDGARADLLKALKLGSDKIPFYSSLASGFVSLGMREETNRAMAKVFDLTEDFFGGPP